MDVQRPPPAFCTELETSRKSKKKLKPALQVSSLPACRKVFKYCPQVGTWVFGTFLPYKDQDVLAPQNDFGMPKTT